MLRKQVQVFKAFVHREAVRAFADDHHVIRFFHHGLRQPRGVFDAAKSCDGAGAVRRSVHHARVQLNFSFFVGQTAVADGIVVGIVFHDAHRRDHGVQRVSAFFQNVHALIQGVQAVGARDDHRARALRGRGW